MFKEGYRLEKFDLPSEILELVRKRNWNDLDRVIRQATLPGGFIFEKLSETIRFSEIEFIISIRSSNEYPDDDGIWHDDGSRILAFSLSLTENPEQIHGGILEIRKKGESNSNAIPTPGFGQMIVFKTGHWGFEHKINKVEKGERTIIAGWCS